MHHPTLFAYLVMGAFPVIGLLFDAFLPRHRAILCTLLVGFLFFPSIDLDLGIFHWDRISAPVLVVLMGVIFRDWDLLLNFRPRWFDLPMLIWCSTPFFSAFLNGYGAYEGMVLVSYKLISWGGPYFIGRLHFWNSSHLIDLAFYLFVGGVVYIPLCIFEIRFSPQLHAFLYGFHQHQFAQTVRGHYYRPTVFLQHGLMVAMWMGMTAYLGWALSVARVCNKFLGMPLGIWASFLALVLVAMQSLGALFLALAVWSLTLYCRRTRMKSLIIIFALIPIAWSVSRATGVLSSAAINQAASIVSADRAGSLAFRLNAENGLIARAWGNPVFGWSTRGFALVQNEMGQDRFAVSDGLWVISFSAYGLVGLISLLLMHLIPVLIVLKYAPPRRWSSEPITLIAGALSLVVATTAIDNLLNAMINPLFLLVMGALPTILRSSDWLDQPIESGNIPSDVSKTSTLTFGRILGFHGSGEKERG
jgi:hypothetical protein